MADINTYKIFTEGDQLYAAMLDGIKLAEKSIFIESYIFADDLAWEFARALAARVKQGVTVKLVIDTAGVFFYKTAALLDFLKQNGIQTHLFHRWTWKNPMRANYRNHRKLMIIDNDLVFLGGFNIHNQPSLRLYGKKRWRDTHIGFQGDLVKSALTLFTHAWDGYANKNELFDHNAFLQLPPGRSQLVPKHLREAYRKIWPRAKRYIYLTTPYLVPDRRTQQALIAAASNGIDVRILVPGKSNHTVTRWASRAAYANLLNHGVRLYEYQPRMLHAKTFVMDDTWASIGSANMDYRSFFLNYELNLFTRKNEICHILKEHFLHDITTAREIKTVNWPNRPWSEKLTEIIGWFARRWL